MIQTGLLLTKPRLTLTNTPCQTSHPVVTEAWPSVQTAHLMKYSLGQQQPGVKYNVAQKNAATNKVMKYQHWLYIDYITHFINMYSNIWLNASGTHTNTL